MLSPRETDRLKERYKKMTLQQFFAEKRRLTRRSQKLLSAEQWDQHDKNEQRLNVLENTLEQMHTETVFGPQQQTTNFKRGDWVRHLDRLGRIVHVHRDGTYTIMYTNGDKKKYVFPTDLQKMRRTSLGSSSSSSSSSISSPRATLSSYDRIQTPLSSPIRTRQKQGNKCPLM
jgi:exonuclease VII large subunit